MSLLIAMPLAHCFYACIGPGKKIFISWALMLSCMPTKLVIAGVYQCFGMRGIGGIIIAHCLLNIPYAFYVLNGAYSFINPMWPNISQEFGATKWQCYKDIMMPFLKPALRAAAIIIFILCFSSNAIPLLLGDSLYHMTPDIFMMQAFEQQNYIELLLCMCLRLIVIVPCLHFMKFDYSIQWYFSSAAYKPSFYKKNNWILLICIYGIFLCLSIPYINLFATSLDLRVINFWKSIWRGAYDPLLKTQIYKTVYTSCCIAFFSSFLCVFSSFLVVYHAAYHERPPVVRQPLTGRAHDDKEILLIFFPRHPEYGRKTYRRTTFHPNLSAAPPRLDVFYQKKHRYLMPIEFVMSCVFVIGSVGCACICALLQRYSSISYFTAIIICHIFLNLPFAYRIIKSARQVWEIEWDLLAQSYGATRFNSILTVQLPLMLPTLFHAFCICFCLSLTEVGVTPMITEDTAPATTTIAHAIKLYRVHGNEVGVMGLSVVSLCCMIIVAIIMQCDYIKKTKNF